MTTCDDARDAAPELALGTLDGGERAELLRHLSVCPACRDETARLVETAEAIGLLAAPVLPSVGFEDRVLAAMGLGTPPVSRRRRWLSRFERLVGPFHEHLLGRDDRLVVRV